MTVQGPHRVFYLADSNLCDASFEFEIASQRNGTLLSFELSLDIS